MSSIKITLIKLKRETMILSCRRNSKKRRKVIKRKEIIGKEKRK
jgi:hypothetical protein